MNELLPYLLKSTLSLSLLHLAFRIVMRKEAFFALNRMVLITVVVLSFIIPLLYLPSTIKPIIQEQIIPQVSFQERVTEPTTTVSEINETSMAVPSPVTTQQVKHFHYSAGQIIFFIYLSGVLFSFLIFMYGIISILFMLRKAKAVRKDGYHVFILEKDLPAFSFCRMVFISRADYTEHGKTILAHEQQHIRLGHFYDLMLMEMVKMIHWFNPIIYWLIQDLKAIHEFQADKSTLTQGIDANKYQLLIIEKGVGSQRFALANSFNHCQIKKRITMMNKQMTSKAGMWKVATFLPLLALLLMAFGRTGENVPPQKQLSADSKKEAISDVQDTSAQSKEKVYNIVESMPEFPGGQQALNKYLRDNIKYPPTATKAGIQGKVFVAFVVTSQGKIINPKVVRSVNPELDAEAVRVIRLMPNWTPGKEKGNPVSVSYTIPINFVLWPDPTDKNVKKNSTSEKESPTQSKDSIYTKVEVMPEFPGGDRAIQKFLIENVKYPKEASAINIQGKVFVNCIINKEGKIVDSKVVKGVDSLLDAEALRVIRLMPNWIPGKDKGKPVTVSYSLPINFVLQ